MPPVTGSVARVVPPTPAPAGFIADVPGLLPTDAKAMLNARIRGVQAAGDGDIGVAIVPSLEGHTPAEVGVAIYRSWRIGRIDTLGSARRNLGVLLLVVPKELAPDHKGQCWITTGVGAEGVVTDAASGAICRDRIIPHLKERDYAAAIGAGVDALAERLHATTAGDSGAAGEGLIGDATPPGDEGGGSSRWWFIPAGLAGAVAAAVGAFRWRRRRPRRCPRCGSRMHRLDEAQDDAALAPGQQVEERVHSVDYDVWVCGACGERLVLPYKKVFTRYHDCRECHRRTCKTTRRVLDEPTYTSTGLAEDTHHCEACGATWTKRVTLPRKEVSSSSSSGSSSGGGGGGGFGGSGATSGGGGGSSY